MEYFRPSEARGAANFGWLDSRHTFSFGNYYDPKHMGISSLRVINEDKVIGGAGFSTHPHKDMEIISYVLKGKIAHKDSMGNEMVVPAGDVQRMSAGTGVYHSEYNSSEKKDLHFLQIWIVPNVKGIKPSYEQKKIEQDGKVTPLISPDGRDGTLSIHQDAYMARIELKPGEDVTLPIKDRTGYLHVISGEAKAGESDRLLQHSDGLGVAQIEDLKIKTEDQYFEAIWFDLPKVA